MYTSVELLESAIRDIDKLTLTGVMNWNNANSALSKIGSVLDALKKQEEAKEKAYNDAIEDAKQAREKQLADAAARGETVIGGQTVKVNADGTTEVIIP